VGTKTHKTAVVIIPPDEVWPPIQAIRRKHDRQFRRWMPHITLIYPFRRRQQFDALVGPFSRVCTGIAPFEVELARFATFRHRSGHTLWLAPEPPDALAQLQTALWRVVPECDEVRRHSGGFTPHLSVGQARGDQRASALLANLQSAWIPLCFRVTEVSLIWRDDPPDDMFQVWQSIPLGAT
jgi:2'-5' RNA ligase